NHQGAFSPDSGIFALGTGDGMISLWDVAGRRKLSTINAHAEFVSAVNFSPDGRTLASGSHDLKVKLWAIAACRPPGSRPLWNWPPIIYLGHRGWGGGGAFSPDGKTMATVSGDSTVHIRDLASRRDVTTLKVHMSQISWHGFCPDGKTLATSSTDQTTKLWNT